MVEPITITRLDARNALLIVANPADEDMIVGLLKSMDVPALPAGIDVRIIPLHHAQAAGVVALVRQILDVRARREPRIRWPRRRRSNVGV